MGKTRIALEYAHRNRTRYDCIFWLEAQQFPKLSFSFASIATQLGEPHAESMGGSRRYEWAKEWLETTGKGPKHNCQNMRLTENRKDLAFNI